MCSVQSLPSIISFLHFPPLCLIHTLVTLYLTVHSFRDSVGKYKPIKTQKQKITKKKNDNLMPSEKQDKKKTGTHQKKPHIKLKDKS